jgi:hypothetical protein
MNHKHIAALLIGLCILGFVQTTLWMKDKLAAMVKEEQTAKAAADKAANESILEQQKLTTLRDSSADLIAFLEAWEPYFASMNTPQGAELGISMRLKSSNLVTLSQRYESAGVKDGGVIPRVMRANLTIDDNYARTLNWLGEMETEIPTLRVSSLRISRGQTANDIRADFVLEVPLATGG